MSGVTVSVICVPAAALLLLAVTRPPVTLATVIVKFGFASVSMVTVSVQACAAPLSLLCTFTEGAPPLVQLMAVAFAVQVSQPAAPSTLCAFPRSSASHSFRDRLRLSLRMY